MTSVGSAEISVRLARDELRRDITAAETLLQRLDGNKVDVDVNPAKKSFEGLRKFVVDNIFQGIAQGIGQQITTSITGAVTGAVKSVQDVLGSSLAKSKDFGEQIRTFSAVSGGSSSEVQAVRGEIEKLSIASTKTSTDIGKSAIELTKLGFNAQQTKTELSGLVSLAEATGETMEKSASIIGATSSVYGRSAKDIADIVAATANSTAADASDFLAAVSKAGAVAKANNQDLETLAVTFGLIRNAGFEAETAATAIKTLISRLSAPTSDEAKIAIKDLGVEIRDSAGNMRNFVALIPEFRAALSKLAPDQKADLVKVIFGDEGGPAFLSLMETSQDKINETTTTIRNFSGAALETQQKLIGGLSGAVTQFTGSLETLQIRLGDSISPAAEAVVNFGVKTANTLLETEGLFDGVTEASKKFADELDNNEELAQGVQVAVKGFVDELADQGIQLATDLTNTLKENPQLLAEMVTAMGGFVKLIGEAVKAATFLGQKLSESGTELQILTGIGGAEAEGARTALKTLGATRAELSQFDKKFVERTLDLSFKEGNAFDVGNAKPVKEFGIEQSKANFNFISDNIREKAASQVIAELEQEIIARNRVQDDIKKASESDAARLPALVDRNKVEPIKTAPITAKPLPRAELSSDRELKQKQVFAGIKDNEQAQVLGIKQKQLRGDIDIETANKQIDNVKSNTIGKEIAAQSAQLAKSKELKAKGLIDSKQFALEEIAIGEKIKTLKLQQVEAEIQSKENANKRILADLERANKQAGVAIQQSVSSRVLSVKEGILANKISEEDAAKQITVIRENATRQEIALLQKELADVDRNEKNKVLTAQQALDKRLELQTQLAAKNEQLVDQEIEAQKRLRDTAIKAIEDRLAADKRRTDLAIANLEAEQKRLVEFAQKSDEITKSLIESRGALSKAGSNLDQTQSQLGLDRTSRALELRRQLDQGKDIAPIVRQTLEVELNLTGFGGSNELAILKQKQQQEDALAEKKAAALVREQKLNQALEEIEIRRMQFAAKTAQYEAQISLMKAKQLQSDSNGALTKAKKLAPGRERDNAIADAQSQISQANEGVQLAQENLGLVKEQVAALQEITANKREILKLDQQSAKEQFNAAEDARKSQQFQEAAQAAARNNSSDIVTQDSQLVFGETATARNYAETAQQSIGIPLKAQLNYQPDKTFLGQYLQAPTKIPEILQTQIPTPKTSQLDLSEITKTIQKLAIDISALAARPSVLQVSTPNAVSDAADIYGNISKNAVRSSGI